MLVTITAGPIAPGPPLPWVCALSRYGSRPAILTAGHTITYADLARRVDELAARLAGPRRLVLLEARSTTESVVSYLAATGRRSCRPAGRGRRSEDPGRA